MSKTLLILAVPHEVQGPNFTGYVDDVSYRLLLESFLDDGVDFVFEEAAGRQPSHAQELAGTRAIGYLDVDPTREQRASHGIAEDTDTSTPIDLWKSNKTYSRLLIDEHEKREELWLKRVEDQPFQKALLICGIAHSLSLAFRFRRAGFRELELYSYTR